MRISGGKESTVRSSDGIMFFCGAVAMLMFAVLTFGNASEWFDVVSGAVYLTLAALLGYRGFRPSAV